MSGSLGQGVEVGGAKGRVDMGDGQQLLKLTEINPLYLPNLFLEAARLNRFQNSKIIASVDYASTVVVWVGRQIPSAFYSTTFEESCSPLLFLLPLKGFWISLNVSKKQKFFFIISFSSWITQTYLNCCVFANIFILII